MSEQRHIAEPQSAPWPLDKFGVGVLLSAYAVLLGASYLFGFWRPFGFIIFPYLELKDYLSAPLNRISVLIAPPILLALVVFGGKRDEKSALSTDVAFYLIAMYAVAFAKEFYQAVTRYIDIDFHFPNEFSVLLVTSLFFLAGVAAAYYAHRSSVKLHVQIAALILVQSAVTTAAGYADGKALYNGAAEVHFLGNKELCEPGGLRDWVYLGNFGGQTFFMNTIDKRLCLITEKNIRLVSRKVKEKL